jgi:hypothetical protein
VGELAQLCRDLGVTRVYGDKFAMGWTDIVFRQCGLSYVAAPLTKSELYLRMLAAINMKQVSLPRDERLLGQLQALQRRATSGGHESANHAQRAGAHDDVANACAGAAVLTLRHQVSRVW